MSSNLHISPCLSRCLANFEGMIAPGDRDFDEICRLLSTQAQDYKLSWLYCCDLKCGEDFNSSAGHDPNVNQVIKKCQGLGISNIVDPGPRMTSQCSSILASESVAATSSPSFTTTSSQLSSPTLHSTPSSTRPDATTRTIPTTSTIFQQTTLPNSPPTASSTPNFPLTEPSTTQTPSQPSISPDGMSIPPPQSQQHTTFWQKLSPDSKIGIIVGVAVLVVLIIGLIIFLVSRQRRRARVLAAHLPFSASSSQQSGESGEDGIDLQRSSPTHVHEVAKRSEGAGPGATAGSGRRDVNVVVVETEGKNSMDSSGNRWPDSVVLTGDAKEMREWSLGYGLEYREGRSRRGEKREKTDMREWNAGYGVECSERRALGSERRTRSDFDGRVDVDDKTGWI